MPSATRSSERSPRACRWRRTDWTSRSIDAAACSEIPADPTAASALIESTLTYFDTHQVSWTASVYEAGKLVKDLSLQDATSLENGWTCGPQNYPAPGIGRVVEAHLRSNEERGLFVVSAGGGPDVARGGFAIGYGPVMAAHEGGGRSRGQPQFTLGKIKVQVTDSRGITHPAAIFYATAGWGQINFVIPPAAATGLARMTIVREDGSRESTQITIADTAPGFWTGVSCRGPAQGVATQVFPDGRKASMQIQECKPGNCWPNAIPVTAGATTRVSMKASGFRYAGSPKDIVATVGGVRVPVISFGPAEDPGVDQVTIEIPASLPGQGRVGSDLPFEWPRFKCRANQYRRVEDVSRSARRLGWLSCRSSPRRSTGTCPKVFRRRTFQPPIRCRK